MYTNFRGWVLPYAIFSTLVNQDSICHVIIPTHYFGAPSIFVGANCSHFSFGKRDNGDNGEYGDANAPFFAYKGQKTALYKL
jgi:hypothetical protein